MHLLCFDLDSPETEALLLCLYHISHIKDGSSEVHLPETHAYREAGKMADIVE